MIAFANTLLMEVMNGKAMANAIFAANEGIAIIFMTEIQRKVKEELDKF